MAYSHPVNQERGKEALRAVDGYIETVFDRAPVMMERIDRDGKLVKVNNLWLNNLGYNRREVLGRKDVRFQTQESRVWAINDCLPLFWRVGSARSIGLHFVKKDGRVLDVLLDGEMAYSSSGETSPLAAIRTGHDQAQWEQASTTMAALIQLSRLRSSLESALYTGRNEDLNPENPTVGRVDDDALEAGFAREALGGLLELGQDISANLRGLLRVQEEWLSTTVEQQREMLLVATRIERTLAELGDSMGAPNQES